MSTNSQEKSGGSTQVHIPASVSLHERRPRTLKHGDTFGLFDHNGDAIAGVGSPDGIYHCDTRHLSHLSLLLAGVRPLLLSSTLRDDNATLTCDLANGHLFDEAGRRILDHDRIHVRRSRFLWNAACFERLAVRNFDEARHALTLQINFAADFADLFEVRGATRPRHGDHHAPEIRPDGVLLSYTGLDKRQRRTILRFDPVPDEVTADSAIFEIDLAPHETKMVFVEVRCGTDGANVTVRRGFSIALRDARRTSRQSAARATTIATSNELFDEAARRSVSDLNMLITETPDGPYPYAGIPWFSTVFGRDALITALEVLWLDPAIGRGVLLHLAGNQASRYDAPSDAEPGKILHEVRHGEMAELGEVPFRRYYGSVDSTPLFVMLAGAYLERTGDLDLIQRIWPNLKAALDWIEKEGDRDGDGFVEYGRRRAEGLVNQGWKDSHDAMFHADGRLAEGPIAVAEVQAYVYGAWQAAANIAGSLGLPADVAIFEARSEAIRRRFDEAFFDPELGTYAMALDGKKQPCRVRSSNAGHALFTGIAHPVRAPSVVSNLMASHSFSGWGIRTVASTELRYNPMSYHNGSVWPHDSALIAAGFARYGFRREAMRIFEGLFSGSIYIELRRLPELFCGFPRQRSRGPTFYPVACSPQAWAAATPLSLIQSCLGLSFNIDAREVMFNEPSLPDFLDEIVLRRLHVAQGDIDVALRRSGREVVITVLSKSEGTHVVTRN